nr:hypothetical protein [Tanacetum cinerariifolium]
MSRDVLTVGSTMRISLLYRGEYSQWVERFMNYLEEQTDGEAMINSFKNGDQPLPRVTRVSIAGTSSTEQPPLKDKSMLSDQEKSIQKIDRLARSLLIQGLSNDIYSLIDSNKTKKDLWDALARHMLGSEYDNCELNFKFLNNLQLKWKQYATMMRQNKNLMDINIDALYNILKQNQEDMNDAMGSKKKTVVVTSNPLALIAEKTNVSRSKEKVVVSSDSEGSKDDDFRCWKAKGKGDIIVFVGYSKESAAFRIYNKQTRKIHESVNVNFDEISKMAFKQFSLEPSLSNLNKTGKSLNRSVSQVDEASKKDLEDLFYDEYFDSSKFMKSSTTNVETSINEEVFHEVSELFQRESSSSSLNDDVQQSPEEVILPQTNTQSISINMIPNGDEASTAHNFNERLEDAYFDARQLANSCLFSCLLSSIEPANVAEALRDADWVSAMQKELDQFARWKVWRLVPRPEGKFVIKTKWIFKNKKDESTIRLCLAYAAHKDFTVFQMDVKIAFLNGILKEEVYAGQPPGFVSKQYPDHVYALDKALYGLKQVPRACTITELVDLIELHDHLNSIFVPKCNGSWRVDYRVVVLVFKARGIPSRFGETFILKGITLAYVDGATRCDLVPEPELIYPGVFLPI